MENNHVISAYEGELKARNDTISALQGQLTAAREATDSEKSTQAQQKRKIKTLQASLSERDELILSLSKEVDAAKLAKAQAVKETEEACLGKIQDHFLQVAEALKELRKGPMYRLNLRGQTVNNMSLVKDLLSGDPPVLEDELKALEEEMTTYGGATEEFEAAFNGVLELLCGKGPEPAGAESSKGQPSDPAQEDGGKGGGEDVEQKDGEDRQDVDP